MIKTIKASKSEKILFVFLIVLGISAFSSFFLLKNKCLFVENNDLEKLNFKNATPFEARVFANNGQAPQSLNPLYP